MSTSATKRGAFIVFEGCDRAGKSTQCRLLVEKLWELGFTVQQLTFPDRSSATGRIINNYLLNQDDLPDKAIHLLFSTNRWECEPKMRKLLSEGVTLVVDRYSYSGVAYSSAKPNLDINWCRIPETGLPKPDLVCFLQLSDEVLQKRKGFGDERYEKSEFQKKVLTNFMQMVDDTWKIIDADKNIEELHEELLKDAVETIKKAQTTELKYLWEDCNTKTNGY